MSVSDQFREYKTHSRVQKALGSCSLLRVASYFFQTAQICLIMVGAFHHQIAAISPTIQNFLENYKALIDESEIFRLVFIVTMDVLLILLFTINRLRHKLTCPIDQFDRPKEVESGILRSVECIGRFCLEVLIIGFLRVGTAEVLCVWQKNLNIQVVILKTLLCLLPVVGYVYFSIFCPVNCSLYGLKVIPVLFMLLVSSSVGTVQLFLLSCFMVLTHPQSKSQRALMAVVVVLSFFFIKNCLITNEEVTTTSLVVSFEFTMIILGLIIALSLRFPPDRPLFEFFEKKNSRRLKEIINKIDQIKAETLEQELSLSEILQIYTYFINQQFKEQLSWDVSKGANSLQKRQAFKKLQQISQKTPRTVEKNEYWTLAKYKVEKIAVSSPQEKMYCNLLKIQLTLKLEESMMSVLNEFENLKKQIANRSWNEKEYFFELMQMISQKYAFRINNEVSTTKLIEISRNKKNFHKLCGEALDSLSAFWRYWLKQSKSKSEVDNLYEGMRSGFTNLDKAYNSLLKADASALTEETIVFEGIKGLQFHGLNHDGAGLGSIKPSKAADDEPLLENMPEYIRIKGYKVVEASMGISGELGLKQDTLSDLQISDIFGKSIADILLARIDDLSADNQESAFVLPVFVKKNVFILKKAHILWNPSLDSGLDIVVRVMETDSNQSHPQFLYNMRTNLIEGVSLKLYQEFNDESSDKTHENWFLRHKDSPLNLEEVVHLQDRELDFSTVFNSHSGQPKCHACKVDAKKLTGRKNAPSQQRSISLQQEILEAPSSRTQEQQSRYAVLSLSPSKWSLEQQGNKSVNESNTTKKYINRDKGESLEKMYQSEKFFCPIQNSFYSKIVEKQAQLEEKNRWRWMNFAHIIVFLVVGILIVGLFLNRNQKAERLEVYSTELNSLENNVIQYGLIYDLYSMALRRYYVNQYPYQTLVMRSYPFFVINPLYKFLMGNYLREFMDAYMAEISQETREIKYSLQFRNFRVETNTSKSTLIDFVENFIKNIELEEFDFVLNNYQSFRQLNLQLEESFTYGEFVEETALLSEQILSVSLALTLALSLLLLFLLKTVAESVDCTYQLIAIIPKWQIQDHVDRIELFSKKYRSRQSSSLGKQPDYQNHPGTLSQTNKKVSSQNSELDIELTKEEDLITLERSNSQLNLATSDTALEESAAGQQQTFKDYHPVFRFVRAGFYIVFSLSIGFILTKGHLELQSEKTNILSLFELKTQLFSASLKVKRDMVDALYKPVMTHYLNEPYEGLPDQDLVLYTHQEVDITLEGLEFIRKQVSDWMQGDLCEASGPMAGRGVLECDQYLNGVFLEGLGKSYYIYKKKTLELKEMQLAEFGTFPCTPQRCPTFLEAEFGAGVLAVAIKNIDNRFQELVTEGFDNLNQKKLQQQILFSLGLLFLFVLYLIHASFESGTRERALNFWLMIPQEAMKSMKVTNHIRKNAIFTKLDKL